MHRVFEYTNYRKYLRDFYNQKKRENSGFSFRVFARRAGVKSPAHLKLVIEGKRNLSLETVRKFSKGLGLKVREERYFEIMVQFNQAKDPKERAQWLQEMEVCRSRTRSRSSRKIHTKLERSLFSHWTFPVVYELSRRVDFEPKAEWITTQTGGRMTRLQASDAFETLVKQGLIQRQENGSYQPVEKKVETVDEVEEHRVRSYHLKMMDLAAEHAEDPLDNREFGFLTVSSSPEKFQKLKHAIKEFIEEAQDLMEVQNGATRTYQMNVQLFDFGRIK